MITLDTYKARLARFLYQHGFRFPRWIGVKDALDAIAAANDRKRVYHAIRSAAEDAASPIQYVDGTGEEAIALVDAPLSQVKRKVRNWIVMWDENELPPELQ